MTSAQMTPIDATRNPIVHAKDGEVFANSRDVAAFFGKEHRNVLAAISSLIEQEQKLGLLNFKQTPYVEPSTGQTYRSYDMDRDGFTLLAIVRHENPEAAFATPINIKRDGVQTIFYPVWDGFLPFLRLRGRGCRHGENAYRSEYVLH